MAYTQKNQTVTLALSVTHTYRIALEKEKTKVYQTELLSFCFCHKIAG